MPIALAVSLAAYATFGVVASRLWPLITPVSAREFEVQLLPSASATPLGFTPPDLAAVTAAPATGRPVLAPLAAAPHPHEPALVAPLHAPPREAHTELVAATAPVADAPLSTATASDSVDSPVSSASSRSGDANGSVTAPLPLIPPKTDVTLPFGPGMTPPRRLSGEEPKYTAQALAARIEGKVIVRCVLTTTGAVRSCRVVEPLAELDGAAVRALEASRFTPVTFQGRPTAVTYLFTFDFRLP